MPSKKIFLTLAAAVLAAQAARRLTDDLDPQRYLADVKFLASEQMRGRATGSPELEKAAAYIVRQFKSDGLQPGDGKSYLQAFSVTTNAKLGSNNRFEYP
jgi:aminopeptidase YwaD